MALRVGLNGAGRIGRALLRLLRSRDDVEIAAVNDVASAEQIAHLCRHDSIHGPFPGSVRASNHGIEFDEREIPLTNVDAPERIPWDEHGVEVVVEATGRFTKGNAARPHLGGSVRRVLVSAVAEGADRMMVLGVQDGSVGDDERVISAASCTTHAAASPLMLLDEWYGIEAAEMGTVHCTTGSQPAIDVPHADPRRARSALLSIIPTTTSAARGLATVLPHLAGRLTCHAVRVPVATVSLIDLVAQTREPVDDVAALGDRFEEAAEARLRGILGVCREPLVSIDFRTDPRSSIIDVPMLARPGHHLVRVIAWYDNEWGYASRIADLLDIWARGTPRA
jgi:glyceraldehyde 3-phosphate dehydrogenase